MKRLDNRNFQSYYKKEKYYQFTLWLKISALTPFAVIYTEPVENTWTKTLQNLCCQIEVSFILESFLIGKPRSFQRIGGFTGIAKLNYNAHVTSRVIIRFLLNIFSCHFFFCYLMGFRR